VVAVLGWRISSYWLDETGVSGVLAGCIGLLLIELSWCRNSTGRFAVLLRVNVKGKGRLWVIQHCCLVEYFTLHSSPEALHTPSGVKDLC
jgi:hypothetical protein